MDEGPKKGKARDLGIMDKLDSKLAPLQPIESIQYKERMLEEQFPYLDGPVADRQRAVPPKEATDLIKKKTLELGADMVGFSELDPENVVEGRPIGGWWAVTIVYAMDHDAISTAPEPRSGIEVTRAYYVLGEITVKLAAYIRSLGYKAYAHHPRSIESEIGSVLHKPIAKKAGIGEIGRNTLLLTPEFGPRVRLATVTTELEVVPTRPMSIGLAEYCLKCHRCQNKCPVGAIPEDKIEASPTGNPDHGTIKLWRLDFKKCLTMFIKTDGCAVCIKECTFNQPPEKAKAFVERTLGIEVELRTV
jgi:epoxyqueuosine reductase QueG